MRQASQSLRAASGGGNSALALTAEHIANNLILRPGTGLAATTEQAAAAG